MTTPNDNTEGAGALKSQLSIKVIGIGGAGCQLLQELPAAGLANAALVAINSDAKALANLPMTEKWLLGVGTVRGLGCGGDPELGRAAAREDLEKLKLLFSGTDLVFILAGLGGGTGTGAAPVIAEAARETGALVVAVVTLPFDFEGARRQRQAQLGLRELKTAADVVLCLPNQKVFKLIDAQTSFLDTFRFTNNLVAAGLCGIWRMLTQTGLMNVDFADLAATTRGRHSESCFAIAEADGEKRVASVIAVLVEHPLLADNAMAEADAVLVTIVGGPDLGITEVDQLMRGINEHFANARLLIGAIVDNAFAGKLNVTLIASSAAVPDAPEAGVNRLNLQIPPEADTEFERQAAVRPPSRFIAPPPEITEEKKQQIVTKHTRGSRRKKASTLQGQLPLEIVSRGRFERSEPTIYQGEDLDVPTYIRRGLLLN